MAGRWGACVVPFRCAARASYSIRVQSKPTGAQGPEGLTIFGEWEISEEETSELDFKEQLFAGW